MKEPKQESLQVKHRWKVLVLLCMFRTATYYCSDITSTLQTDIMQDMHITATQFGMLSSILSVPTIFTAFLTGLIVDRTGVLNLIMPLISLVCVGMAIQTAAAYLLDFQLMLIGRFVFALGCESINLLKGIIVSDWFFGKELSTANSINLSFVRGIVFVSGAFTPLISEKLSLTHAFSTGFLVCIISFFATYELHEYQKSLEEQRREEEKASAEAF